MPSFEAWNAGLWNAVCTDTERFNVHSVLTKGEWALTSRHKLQDDVHYGMRKLLFYKPATTIVTHTNPPRPVLYQKYSIFLQNFPFHSYQLNQGLGIIPTFLLRSEDVCEGECFKKEAIQILQVFTNFL